MNFNNKKAFTITESIVGFFLFSSMLLLYLPAYYNEMERMEGAIAQTNYWRVFSDLVEVELNSIISEESRRLQQDMIIELWEADQENNVSQFYCDEYLCLITFSEGHSLYVEIEEVN
ncbi:hypothetical protein ACF3NG_03920 [Aerococcaceae bacterium WGS1372]